MKPYFIVCTAVFVVCGTVRPARCIGKTRKIHEFVLWQFILKVLIDFFKRVCIKLKLSVVGVKLSSAYYFLLKEVYSIVQWVCS
jgi:hypothetical protein